MRKFVPMRIVYDSIPAVVLAGGINRIELFEGYRAGYKGLLRIGGKPLIQYTLDALRLVPAVNRICIVGPVDRIQQEIHDLSRLDFIPAKETLFENVVSGLQHLSDSPAVLFIPSDLPLATPESIIHFLDCCRKAAVFYPENVYWSVIPEEKFSGPYAEVKKGFNRFRDISICHGNLFLLTTGILQNRTFFSLGNNIYHSRKSSIRTALVIGPAVGLSYLFGVHILRILTLAQMARIVSVRLGAGIIPIVVDHPELAIDVDEKSDFQFILSRLNISQNRPGRTVCPMLDHPSNQRS